MYLVLELLYFSGFLFSWDDFYIMDNGLVMLQTTNDVFNMSLFDYVTPQTVPSWIRVRVANQKSVKSSDWGPYVQQYNSGHKDFCYFTKQHALQCLKFFLQLALVATFFSNQSLFMRPFCSIFQLCFITFTFIVFNLYKVVF